MHVGGTYSMARRSTLDRRRRLARAQRGRHGAERPTHTCQINSVP